ncbi:MAG: CHAT domain-containing protein [Agriterribacter sp.]
MPFGQLKNLSLNYHDLYLAAEKFYNSDKANEKTDSIALAAYTKVIQLLENSNINDSILFDSYYKKGLLLTSIQNDSGAIQDFLTAIKLNKSSSAIPDSISFLPWVFAGSNYYSRYMPDSALSCYEQAEALLLLHPHLEESERLFNKLGVLYYDAGDYKKSIAYFNKALSLVDSSKTNAYFLVNYKNNIASAYRKLGLYDKALEIYKSLISTNIYKDKLLHNIGVTYADEGNFEQALFFLKQVPYKNIILCNDVARAYIGLDDLNLAEQQLIDALQLLKETPQHNSFDIANMWKLRGNIMMAKNHPLSALEFYQQSINTIYPSFKDTSIFSNPQHFKGLYPFTLLFDVLKSKANCFNVLYKQSPFGNDYLELAFSTYASVFELTHYMERIYGSDESRLFLKKNVDLVYKAAVETGIQLFERTGDSSYLKKTVEYAENNKASVLQAGSRGLALETMKDMPVDLLRKEKQLKAHLTALNLNETATLSSQQEQKELEIELSRVQQQLDQHPAYYNLKFGYRSHSIDELQHALLNDQQAIISFYETDSSLIRFFVTKQHFGYLKTALPTDLQNQVLSIRAQMDSAFDAAKTNLYTALYQKLIAGLPQAIFQKPHWIVVPYGEISYLPFEILINPANKRTLLQDYAISYQYSVNFLNTAPSPGSDYSVLAMAPFANTNKNLESLPVLAASLHEINGLPGTSLIDSAASKKAFVLLAADFTVLHLATHAIADDSLPERSQIFFYCKNKDADTSFRLYEQEIYNLYLDNTKLAILSACETGGGRLIGSEGIISLSRAFAYAGCKGTITSLWRAEDKSTAFIMQRLHTYLQKGNAIDDALQKAKLDFLQSTDIPPGFKKPAFWATLILIGDAHPLVKSNSYWMLVAAGIILPVLFFVFIKAKSRTK